MGYKEKDIKAVVDNLLSLIHKEGSTRAKNDKKDWNNFTEEANGNGYEDSWLYLQESVIKLDMDNRARVLAEEVGRHLKTYNKETIEGLLKVDNLKRDLDPDRYRLGEIVHEMIEKDFFKWFRTYRTFENEDF